MNHATPARFHISQAGTGAAPALAVAEAAPLRDDAATSLRAQLPPPHRALQACVIIPAKDEAAGLPATLAALAAQLDRHGQPWPVNSFEIIVLANNCHDATAEVVRAQARRYPQLSLHVAELCLPPAQAHVGRARRLLMDEAGARLELVGQPAGLILSTDADTQVAPNWLAANLAAVAAGAEAVGGRILTLADELNVCPTVRRTQLRDAAYHLLRAQLESRLDPDPADPWPRHHQHFGASLALTARAYRRVGGLPDVRYLEDEALWQALRRHDVPLRHCPAVRVVTSGRHEGRVEVGLSWQLRQWATLHQQQAEPLVECPAQLAALWRARRQLRAVWAGRATLDAALAQALRIGLPELTALLGQAAPFGQLWEDVLAARRAAGDTIALQPLSLALAGLRLLLARA
ncbi:glycosyltransferase [Hymenobacter sp. ASUV-10]|uniref:Glycosyltransferase n=1 Tax=Hymenobacter aranciens TaxID=3063996 RepID=A0ABT9BJ75_9BACT|nr:glycosyltransferase [Hymenobacter sp. ASUV-10]MDO7877062.1 glycosyltransferase [Hymenobacter sp. ASUV-10]